MPVAQQPLSQDIPQSLGSLLRPAPSRRSPLRLICDTCDSPQVLDKILVIVSFIYQRQAESVAMLVAMGFFQS